MGKSQETFNKKEKEKKRLKKRLDKQKKREERKTRAEEGGVDSMMAYVDEDGNITDTPPDLTNKKKINPKNIEVSVPKKEKEDLPAIRTGKVEFYNDSKGFGFIKETGTQEKYFFQVNGLLDEVWENDKVTFEIERGLKGMNAVRVKKG